MSSSRQQAGWGRRGAGAGRSPGAKPPGEKNPWLRVPWWLYVLATLVVLVLISELTKGEPASVPGPAVTVTETEMVTQPPATVTETVEGPPAEGGGDEPALPDKETAEPETPVETAGGDVYYDNCDEARAAGDAPLYVGDPGYGPHLDRDGDGVACEPYAGP